MLSGGDFPARYRRLADEIQSKLRTFARKSDGKIRWQFIDVASGDEKTIGDTELALYEQGLRFTRIAHREAGVTAFQNIWPCAMVTVQGVDYQSNSSVQRTWTPTVMVQNAINQVEFNLGKPCALACETAALWLGCCKATGPSCRWRQPTSPKPCPNQQKWWMSGRRGSGCPVRED